MSTDQLREALKFYAELDNYAWNANERVGSARYLPPVLRDEGERARRALSAAEEKGTSDGE